MRWMCSADAHINEPADLWSSRMPKAMVDAADDSLSMRMLVSSGNMQGDDGMPPPDDVAARLKLLEEDGIWAETIIGNRAGLFVLSIEEPDIAHASARAYNDYIADAFAGYTDRELAIGFIPIRDLDESVKEIERCAALGLPGITLPTKPIDPYHLEQYEPLWAAANAHGFPVSFHATTGGKLSESFAKMSEASPKDIRTRAANKTLGATTFGNEAYQVLGSLIGAGVLDRYPELEILFVETNAAWLVSAMEAMDAQWAPIPGESRLNDVFGGDPNREDASSLEYLLGGVWPYSIRPSDYVRRQVHATFQDELAAIKLREFIGIDQLLWGSDFPHPEGTWPHSKKIVDELFAGVPAAEREAIVGGNVAKIYNIQVPTAA
jgi:predicted TIM-barrel fold metal-dependent hydrolase